MIWDASSGRKMFALPADHGSVWAVSWSPDGTRLAVGSQDGTIRVLEELPLTLPYPPGEGGEGRVRGDGRTVLGTGGFIAAI